MVRPDSRKISRASRYSGLQTIVSYGFSYTRLSLSLAALSRAIPLNHICTTQVLYNPDIYTPLPPYYNAHRLSRNISLGLSRFAHHYSGNHFRFLFLSLLRCFSSRRSLSYPIYSDKSNRHNICWVAPFGDLRITASLTANRNLSQSFTSFFVS